MPRTFSEGLEKGLSNYFAFQKAKQDTENSVIDRLYRQAQMKELGYDVSGGRLQRDPNAITTKQLELAKLQKEIDDKQLEEDFWKNFQPGSDVVQTGFRKFEQKKKPLIAQSFGADSSLADIDAQIQEIEAQLRGA